MVWELLTPERRPDRMPRGGYSRVGGESVWQKQGCDAQSGALARHPWEHLSAALRVHVSEHTLAPSASLAGSQGKAANPRKRAEPQLLTVGQIWLFRALNPDLHKQFLASSASSLMHHYRLSAIWLSAQHLTHSLSPLKKKSMENSQTISVNYFPMD